MSASRNRPLWSIMSPEFRGAIEKLCGGTVQAATSCPGGFSPGFASRLTLTDGRRVFVKAIDGTEWPHEVPTYQAEIRVAERLPASAPAPQLLGAIDDPLWTVLAFECVDGSEPARPWSAGDLQRTLDALDSMRIPAPYLSDEHPRLGGWTEVDADLLRPHSSWAADHLPELTRLERAGLAAARGDDLVHFDLYPHNMLMTPDRVAFVDWPHARRGNRLIDRLTVLISVAADGLDPQPYLGPDPVADAILAAHTGFLVAGGLMPLPPGLEPIGEAKLRLGLGALAWLHRRIG